jgi:siroheme decarboxylase
MDAHADRCEPTAGSGATGIAHELPLLNGFQRDFPLTARPFLDIGQKFARSEADVLDTFRRLSDEGVVSRLGAVFAPRCAGASTLAAMAVPAERLEQIAAIVSSYPQVNHNYEREGALNLWFVATTDSVQALNALLSELERRVSCEILRMPLEREFHIDLGFDLSGGADPDRAFRRTSTPEQARARRWTPAERRLQRALQDGLPLVVRPYRELAARAALTEASVRSTIRSWLQEDVLRRFGIVVRHHELGYTANAMCVWDVPERLVDDLGARLAAAPHVTLCYRRRRAGPRWPFNLYCMVHGRRRDEVAVILSALARQHELGRFRSEVLYSRRRFKQGGARYLNDPSIPARIARGDDGRA